MDVRRLRRLLSGPPAPPRRPDLFTPDLYPGSVPAPPARGAGWDGPRAAREVAELTQQLGPGPRALARRCLALDDRVPDPGIRAALAVLAGTVAGPVAAAFCDGQRAGSPGGGVTTLRLGFGEPEGEGRIVGPPRRPEGAPGGPAGGRVVNARYRSEHPALLAPSLAHALLWTPATTGHAAETMLHALCAMVHCQLVARLPELAHQGTELAQRQNALALSLLNSRPAGDWAPAWVAPGGPETIPGGNPDRQSADFWSIPFGPVRDDGPVPLPAAVAVLADPGAPPGPEPRFAEPYGTWLGGHLDPSWLPPRALARAALALGVLDPARLTAPDRAALEAAADLAPALAVWDRPPASPGSSG